MRTFRRALQRDAFCCTAELFLPRQATAGDALRQAAELAPHVDGIQLAENPHDWVQISPPALAALLLRQGIDAGSRLHCRGGGRIALQSDLRGLNNSVGDMNANISTINKQMRILNRNLGAMGNDVNRMSSPVKMFPFNR